jgi:hypothetical protein
MKLVGVLSTAVLSLTLGVGVPAYAQQEQHDQQEDKDKKAQPEKAKPEEKNAKQEDKNIKPEERNARQENARPEEKKAQQEQNKPEERNAQEQRAQQGKTEQHAGGGRIPDDRFKANFGREHSFRVSEANYRDRRFQYGGYWFGFASAWPSNWLYTQDVYVIEIDGVYYLCNASYPGVNLTLSFTL